MDSKSIRNSGFILAVLIGLVGVSFDQQSSSGVWLSSNAFKLLAAETDVVATVADPGHENQEEAEHDEEAGLARESSELLRDLLATQEDLSRRVHELDRELAGTKERLGTVAQLVKAVEELARLDRQLEAARESGESDAAERIEEQHSTLESQIRIREQQLEIDGELFDVRESLTWAREDRHPERILVFTELQAGLLEVQQILRQLYELDSDHRLVDQLEAKRERVENDRIDLPRRALRLLEEIEESHERGDEEYLVELERQLDDTLKEIRQDESTENGESQVESTSDDDVGTSKEQETQSVVVNHDTLAQFADFNLKRDVVPLLQRYCFDCHSDSESSGRLNFQRLLRVRPIVSRREMWINVIEQTKNHVMPPEDAMQPTLSERQAIVLSLHNAIFDFDYESVRNPGFEGVRRLTHREFSNTVRDLFETEIDVASRFPDDLSGTSGFDNSANSLFIQPLLMERYVSAVEHVVETALPTATTNLGDSRTSRSYARVFVSRPSTLLSSEVAAERIVRVFLRRAFRRLPDDSEVERYAAIVQHNVDAGKTFEESVKAALQVVLISPNFLLRAERSRPEASQPYAVNDWDLASRLSYFLWASMPDDELLELAEQGELSKDGTLAKQVERMLSDPKSETLGSVFASQWLGSQFLGKRVRLDPIDNPWCTESLMAAMRAETTMFFHHLAVNDRPVAELIDADYTFLNEELAKLYRIHGVSGATMRRVSLGSGRRGGILGHGSLLAVTSFPGRTSPVVRGKWVLDTVLGTPPPPPPPNVSELSEEIERRERLTFREKLELHRRKPNCYACHSQMDPLGFSLENYDWFGRYRTRRDGRRIDARGELPDGTSFQGLSGLKQVIVTQRRDDLVRQLTQKLLSYALGRQLEYYDEASVRRIIANSGGPDAHVGALIRQVALSFPFRYKQNPAKSNAGSDQHQDDHQP